MTESAEFANGLDKFLKAHEVVTKDNAQEIIDYLLPNKSMWPEVETGLYAQIIICIGQAYGMLGDNGKAISFLKEQKEKFFFQYPDSYGSISDIFLYLAIYHALELNEAESLEAFKEHVSYYLINRNDNYDNLSLYSYRSCNEYTLGDLRNNTLTVANPKTFNDPMDCLIQPWFKYQSRHLTSEGDNLAVHLWVKALSYVKVRSFRRNEPLLATNNENPTSRSSIGEQYEPLMWAHYADSHKGFCVKYVFPSDITTVKMTESAKVYGISFWGDVNYESDCIFEKLMKIKTAFFRKSRQWEYENEVRLLHYDPTWNGDYKPLKLPSGCVKEVHFGLKCSKEDKIQIRDALNGQEVDFYDIVNKEDDFYKLASLKCEFK